MLDGEEMEEIGLKKNNCMVLDGGIEEEDDANLMNSTAKRLQDVFKITMAFGGMCLEEEQEVHVLHVFPS